MLKSPSVFGSDFEARCPRAVPLEILRAVAASPDAAACMYILISSQRASITLRAHGLGGPGESFQ